MGQKVKRVLQTGALAAAVLAIGSPSANAAVTIGGNLEATPNGFTNCGAGCTLAHSALPPSATAPGGVVAPVAGVVVRWRIKAGADVSPVALRITRPGNDVNRTGAGTGPLESANAISTFDVRLPIAAGDALGVDTSPGQNLTVIARRRARVTGSISHGCRTAERRSRRSSARAGS